MEVSSPGYPLRPEIVESAWYLYLYTGSGSYRDMGRKIFSDLVKYCRTDVAYAHLADVRTKEKADAMESFFFAETIKYLYLLFTDRLRTPDDVVFNTEAHPYRVLWSGAAPGPVPPPDTIPVDMAPALSDSTRAVYEAKLAEANKALEASPADPDLLIWSGRRTAYLGRYDEAIRIYTGGLRANPVYAPFYRHRGHRYITVRMFDRAIADLESAVRLIGGVPDRVEEDGLPNRAGKPTSTLQTNIYYHLALAYYLKGDFASAERNFRACLPLAKNDDMLVAASDWLYMSCRRQGKSAAELADILAPINEKMTIHEDSAYFNRLLMYKGLRTPESLLEGSGDEANGVTIATYGYGVANWYLYNGETEKARELLERVVAGTNKAAFGYIAAEADLERGLPEPGK
jgi:tetratricopeptide (TPR) repeat protein